MFVGFMAFCFLLVVSHLFHSSEKKQNKHATSRHVFPSTRQARNQRGTDAISGNVVEVLDHLTLDSGSGPFTPHYVGSGITVLVVDPNVDFPGMTVTEMNRERRSPSIGERQVLGTKIVASDVRDLGTQHCTEKMVGYGLAVALHATGSVGDERRANEETNVLIQIGFEAETVPRLDIGRREQLFGRAAVIAANRTVFNHDGR